MASAERFVLEAADAPAVGFPAVIPTAHDAQLSAGECDRAVLDRLVTRCYDELRAIAARQLADERAGNSHQVTSLTHEAVLRIMAGSGKGAWERPSYFFAAAAEAMRRILVEAARRRRALKRGRRSPHVPDVHALAVVAHDAERELILIDDTLDVLAERDAIAAEVVRLRYFGGMTLGEVALALGIPERTVDRRWAYARAWLARHLRRVDHAAPSLPVQRA
jgi:RNA polymerase sigma factor (TIGR02999 family)